MTEKEWNGVRKELFIEFTHAATQVLDEAVGLTLVHMHAATVPPVLILLCILRRWDKSGRVGVEVLEACGVDRQAMEHDAVEELQAVPQSAAQNPDLEAVARLATLAKEAAVAQGRNYVGTEHLVMALFGMGNVALSKLLAKHGVAPERFQQKLVEILGC